jgi:putative RNA 2'-phosphotransferase
MSRQYVHLSSDFNTAVAVGMRHDRNPVVLSVDSARMAKEGFRFFHSANDGTWMCDNVPAGYICGVEYAERSKMQ